MNHKARLQLAGLALATVVPFGIGLLAHSAPIRAADPLACIVGGPVAGAQPQALVDSYSGGADDNLIEMGGGEPTSHVTSLS
jgi:hypothetical protein